MATNPTNNTGAGTSSPWNDSGFAFAPSTNTLDRASMPSDAAEAARQKTAAVMAALKRGDSAEADRLMGENKNTQGQLVSPGPLRWLKQKLSGGKKTSGDGESVMSGESVKREEVIVGGGKGEK